MQAHERRTPVDDRLKMSSLTMVSVVASPLVCVVLSLSRLASECVGGKETVD